MCEPTTIILAVGAVIGAVGQVRAGRAANETAKSNAQVNRIMADDALARGAADEAAQRRKTASFKGEQAAIFGASGAEINTGSSLDILADTAEFGELDALRIRNNAEREAFGFEAGARISETSGKNAQTTGALTGAGTLIGGAGAVSSRWKVFKANNPSAAVPAAMGTFGAGGT